MRSQLRRRFRTRHPHRVPPICRRNPSTNLPPLHQLIQPTRILLPPHRHEHPGQLLRQIARNGPVLPPRLRPPQSPLALPLVQVLAAGGSRAERSVRRRCQARLRWVVQLLQLSRSELATHAGNVRPGLPVDRGYADGRADAVRGQAGSAAAVGRSGGAD
uniref:(northern house mosquito) hypothetical protein n=1 Tax=Culex pipiens TaxID=7175 RepID=A0A8D8ATY6_CULPI